MFPPTAPIYEPASSFAYPPYPPPTNPELDFSANPFSGISQLGQQIIPQTYAPSTSTTTHSTEMKTIVIEGVEYDLRRTFACGQHIPHKDKLFLSGESQLVYKGETANGIPHGIGTLFNHDGSRYVGLFSRIVQKSGGVFPRRIKSVYTGSFQNGVADGLGKICFAEGQTYVGSFKNGIEDGKGELTISPTRKYSGEFKNGVKHGMGIESFDDNSIYKGTYKNGLRHGSGEYIFSDSSRYIGEFKNNLQDGEGQEFLKNGKTFKGKFLCGIRQQGKWGVWKPLT